MKKTTIAIAWLLVFSMAIPTALYGTAAKAADMEAGAAVTDDEQMNMAMPYITISSGAKLVAAKDFNSTNGTINGTGTYSKEAEVNLADKTIMDKALTLEEVKNLNKSISVVFRAKVNTPVSAMTSPVLTLANKNGQNFKRDSTGKLMGGTAVYLCGAPGTVNKISTFTRKDGSTVSSGSTHYDVSDKGLITNDGKWHTVAFVHNEVGFVYYVDGVAVITNTTDKILADNTQKIGDLFDDCDEEALLACFGTFGNTGYNNNWNFNGLMDYYQLYDGALSAAEVKTLTNQFGPTTKVYTKEEIESNYRTSDGSKIAPTLEGYVFGGWYKNEDYEQGANALLEGQALTQDKYYALFVPETVLGVKAQVTSNLLDNKRGDDSIAAIRFATSVDSANYQKVGFIFNFEGSTEKDWEAAGTGVYDQMFAYNPATGDKEAAETRYTPANTFSPASQYFKTYTFYGLSAKLYDVNITARPFWITLDGTKVFGRDGIKTVNMGRSARTIYIASNGLDAGDGSESDPYRTLEYALGQAATGDVIYVKDQVAVTTDGWTDHGKDVMITGDTLDFSTLGTVNIKDAVTLTDMNVKFKDDSNIFVNGNRYRVDQNTNITGYTKLYGGGNKVQVASTDVTLLAGDYSRIFGGGVGTASTVNVLGDTNLYIGGDVNKTKDLSGTNACLIFGGSNNGDIKGNTNVYVGGNVNITQNLTADENLHTILYGGSSLGVVYGDTNLKVSDNAQFNRIVGGSTSGTVKGAVRVTVEGNVNSSLNSNSHVMNHAALIGGCVSSTTAASVEGGTYITINGKPRFVEIYGGGAQLDTGKNTVTDTHVEVTEDAKDARIMSIFGGSYNVKTKSNVEVGSTSVVIKAGTVAQVFGGCYMASMVGNTDVQILGGTITRRIYGGCYNNWDWEWKAATQVTGNTTVTIGEGAILKLNDSGGDCGLLAGSRYKETFDGEVGTIVFLNGADCTLGRRDNTSLLGNPKAYNYLVKASSGGTVTAEGNMLRIKSDEGKDMTVVGAAPELQSDGSCILALTNIGKNGQRSITVSFE